jgi:hypothetical protein
MQQAGWSSIDMVTVYHWDHIYRDGDSMAPSQWGERASRPVSRGLSKARVLHLTLDPWPYPTSPSCHVG